VEDEEETDCFSTHLSLVNIRDTATFLTKDVATFLTKGRCAFILHIFDYASKEDVRFSEHVSFYHENGCASHHKSGRVSFYHESGHVSHSVYRKMSVRLVHLRFPIKKRAPR
jgi:hypothetical protein